MLTLADLSADERGIMDLIADCPAGPNVGLDGSTLDIGQRIAWQQLREDGLTDFINDSSGKDWLILTDRGRTLRETGEVR